MNKTTSHKLGFTLAGVLALYVLPARADIFGSGANTFNIDFVDVGNPGNADDRAFDNFNDTPGDPTDDEYASPYGGVAYAYRMGTYEICQEQIDRAADSGFDNFAVGAWTGSQPAAILQWYDAAAFVNWLNTSTGHQPAYDLAWTGFEWAMNLWRYGGRVAGRRRKPLSAQGRVLLLAERG